MYTDFKVQIKVLKHKTSYQLDTSWADVLDAYALCCQNAHRHFAQQTKIGSDKKHYEWNMHTLHLNKSYELWLNELDTSIDTEITNVTFDSVFVLFLFFLAIFSLTCIFLSEHCTIWLRKKVSMFVHCNKLKTMFRPLLGGHEAQYCNYLHFAVHLGSCYTNWSYC